MTKLDKINNMRAYAVALGWFTVVGMPIATVFVAVQLNSGMLVPYMVASSLFFMLCISAVCLLADIASELVKSNTVQAKIPVAKVVKQANGTP